MGCNSIVSVMIRHWTVGQMYVASLVSAIYGIHTKGNLAAYPVDPVEFFAKACVHGSFALGPVVDEFQHVYAHIV